MSQTAPPHQVRQGQPGERLDTILRTTTTRGWWALAFVGVFVAAWVVWAFVATLPQQVTFTATVNADVYTRQVTAPATGTVTGDHVNVGRTVAEGETLGQIVTAEGTSVSVTAPADGTVSGIQAQQGQWVELGDEMGRILTQPDVATGISFVTYLPLNVLSRAPVGSEVDVTVEDPATGQSYTTSGTVDGIGVVPATSDTMLVSSQSTALTDQWLADSNGTAYAVEITVRGWDEAQAGFLPVGGQVATVVRTYADLHPIQIIFGGN